MISRRLNRIFVLAVLFWSGLCSHFCPQAHAGAVLYRIREKDMIKQQQQQMAYQQYLAQQGMAQPGAPGAPGGQGGPAPLTYQQQIDQRNQSIAQAIRDAHSDEVPFGNDTALPPASSAASAGPAPAGEEEAPPSSSSDTVDLVEVWKKLDKKSTIWEALDDNQAKVLTVSEYIQRFRKEGVRISQPPLHYVQMIDQVSKENPQMLQRPFGEVLQVMAIIEYDFDNGVNKDELARKVLGEAGFEANKKRFTQ